MNIANYPYLEMCPVRRGWETVAPVFNIVAGRGYIAGSWAAFMATPHDSPILPNDIDIFATSEDNAMRIANNLCDQLGMIYFDNSLVCTVTSHPTLPDIQIVRPAPEWTNFPEDIILNFDLDISRAVLIGEHIVVADLHCGFKDGKILRVNNALRSLKRVMKYHDRGIQFNDHELLKLFQAWDQMPAETKAGMVENARREVEQVDESQTFDSSFYSDDRWFDGE